jgi:hypothetical protein
VVLAFGGAKMKFTVSKFNPEAVVPDTDFKDKNSVDRYLECGRFRRCANLLAIQVRLPDCSFYMPVCTKSRFNRRGFAKHIEMPVPRQPVGPVTYTTLAQWGPLISCPRNCQEYQNPTLAKIKSKAGTSLVWISTHFIKPSEIWWAAFWAWVMK